MNFKDYNQEVALFIPSLTLLDDLAILWDGGTTLEAYLIDKETGEAVSLNYVTVYGVTNLNEAKEYASKFARAMEEELMGRDITYEMVVKRSVENDGWTYQRHGPQAVDSYECESFAELCEKRPLLARGELLRLIKIYKDTTGNEL